jgi:hypothetical protein
MNAEFVVPERKRSLQPHFRLVDLSVCEIRMGNRVTGNFEEVTKTTFFLLVTVIEFS